MLKIVLCLLALAGAPDLFKEEKAPLEAAVDKVVSSTGIQWMQHPKAAYLEGYGVVVALEVAPETPRASIFGYLKTPAEVLASWSQHRKDLQEKLTASVKQRVTTMESLGPNQSLAVVVNLLNSNPADVPDMPSQFVFTVKKQAEPKVVFREF